MNHGSEAASGKGLADPIVELTGVSKSFGGAPALSNVSFELVPGEVHALVGMNGAGKSTLVGILSGAYRPDAGEICVNGKKLHTLTPRLAREHSISTVPQKRDLVSELTVTENLFLGNLPCRGGLIDWKAAHARAAEVLELTAITGIAPEQKVAELTVAEQTKVQIAREIQRGGKVLILDEPTASLSGADALDVHDLVKMLRTKGTAIIYISHHLDEILGLADRVTILRDGQKQLTTSAQELTIPDLVYAMAGDHVESDRPERLHEPGELCLEINDLTVAGRLQKFSIDVRAGEVVAVLGPAGHGQSSLFPALAGLKKPTTGTLKISGKQVPWGNVPKSLSSGLRCITGDRLNNGLVGNLTVDENIVMFQHRFEKHHLMSWKAVADRARELRDRFHIAMLQQNPPVGHLSGGNQQKVLLAKWLNQAPTIVLLEEPTNGVDVAAKAEIHRMVDNLVSDGTGILLVGSDVDEILRLADRVAIINGDTVVSTRHITDLSRDELIALTVGRTDDNTTEVSLALSQGAASDD